MTINEILKVKNMRMPMNTDNEDCRGAIKRIVPRIDIEKIAEFIDEMPYIAELQKEFHKKYVAARYEKIILPAFEHIQDISQNEELKMNM